MRTSFNNALDSDNHVHHAKVRVINTSGRKWVLEAIGKVKRDIDGKAVRMVGTARDITERRHAEEKSEGVTLTLTGRKNYIYLAASVLSMHKVLVSITDITERRQAENALKKTHDELEQRIEKHTFELKDSHEQLLHSEKLSAIGGLSASIAHEFNNLLQGVITVIKGVKRRTALDAEDVKLVDMAINECTRMKDLSISASALIALTTQEAI